jgi:GNAT superfamily N-acetyltransferase
VLPGEDGVIVRSATSADLAAVTNTISLAFHDDPTWSWGFPDAAHPHSEPHFYLSLLGTHPDHAGRGIGMALLTENRARLDAEHMPAYLESSNPANNHRYERHGFEAIGAFYPPGGDTPVTGMWRDRR